MQYRMTSRRVFSVSKRRNSTGVFSIGAESRVGDFRFRDAISRKRREIEQQAQLLSSLYAFSMHMIISILMYLSICELLTYGKCKWSVQRPFLSCGFLSIKFFIHSFIRCASVPARVAPLRAYEWKPALVESLQADSDCLAYARPKSNCSDDIRYF